jgi:mannonate dehydratase
MPDNTSHPSRRQFGKLAVTSSIAGPAVLSHTPHIVSAAENNAQPKLVYSLSSRMAPDDVKFCKQLGLEYVQTGAGEGGHNAENYRRIRERVESLGLKLFTIGNGSVSKMEQVILGLPGRDEKIEEFKQNLRALGVAGVPYFNYDHTPLGTWRAEPGEYREGVDTRLFDLSKPMKPVHGRTMNRPDPNRVFTEDELWENYTYFIKQVAPVAEEAKVRIGIHPNDPPGVTLGNVPRCIFSSFDGYKRAMEIADSDYVGLCLCTGCWLEGGESMGKDVIETIRYFGSRKKLFLVHFRNVSATVPKFAETFLDDGYMNMYKVMKALVDVGYDGGLHGDHWPAMIGGPNVGTAYTVGHIKALLNSALTEVSM